MSDMGDQLAAALNGHEVTSDDGNLVEGETTNLDSAPEEQTPVEETTKVESTTDSEDKGSKPDNSEPETEEVADETGKRYIPKDRFDKIYAKQKAAERELAAIKAQSQGYLPTQAQAKGKSKGVAPQIDKAEYLEVEVLKGKLPQFDPESPDYSQELDDLGGQIFRANPGITRFDAAKRAISIASSLTKKVAAVQGEARTVKSLQSDQGITNRVISRASAQVDTSKMNDKELEAYMKQNGLW